MYHNPARHLKSSFLPSLLLSLFCKPPLLHSIQLISLNKLLIQALALNTYYTRVHANMPTCRSPQMAFLPPFLTELLCLCFPSQSCWVRRTGLRGGTEVRRSQDGEVPGVFAWASLQHRLSQPGLHSRLSQRTFLDRPFKKHPRP